MHKWQLAFFFPCRCMERALSCMNLARRMHGGMLGPPGRVQEEPIPRGAMGFLKPEQPANDIDSGCSGPSARDAEQDVVPPSGGHWV